MKFITTIFIAIAVSFSCSNFSNKIKDEQLKKDSVYDSVEKNENDFQEFILLLPKIGLPFSIFCADCCAHTEFDFSNELFGKYLPEGSYPVGIISNKNDFIILLVTYAGDMRIPSLVVYDTYGKILDDKNFMTGYCGGELDFSNSQYFEINEDLTIHSTDTIYNFKLDSITHEIIDTIKLEVSKKEYQINSNGQIVEK